MPDTATPHRGRSRWLAAAAGLAVATGLAAWAFAGSGSGTGGEPSGEPIPLGGGAAGSCVEFYDREAKATLANREVAFDGTVASVNGDEIRFTVNTAYKGLSAGEVTLKGASTLGGVTSTGPGVSLERGTRLLVAGDGGFAWGCGFTQPHDPAVAAEWAATFGR